MEGIRLLADEAPRLPLSDCTMPEACNCRFQKYPDRRSGYDRRLMIGLRRGYGMLERRQQPLGRRATDV